METMTGTESRDPRFAELDQQIKAEDFSTARSSSRRKPKAPGKRRPRERQSSRRTARPAGQPDQPTLAQGKALARRMAESLVAKFGQQLNRAEMIQVAQAFRAAIVPRRKPGRRQDVTITRALAMHERGKEWPEIIPRSTNEWRMKRLKKNLREGVRNRLRRARHRTKR
jgi:hypothetical protein